MAVVTTPEVSGDPASAGAAGASSVQLVAGTAIAGKVGIDQTTPGTTNAVDVKTVNGGTAVATNNGATSAGTLRVTLSNDSTGQVALAAGTNIAGKVGIDQTTGGTTNGVALTTFGPVALEDAVCADAAPGVYVLGQRQDSRLSPVSATGDYHALIFDTMGRLKVWTSGSPNDWNFTGTLTNATASTIKAAAGAATRNRLIAAQISHTALGAATILLVRDGAAGTTIFQTSLNTAANEGISFRFDPPIFGSNNLLMEVVLNPTPTSGTVYVNIQGDIITS